MFTLPATQRIFNLFTYAVEAANAIMQFAFQTNKFLFGEENEKLSAD